MFRYNTAKVLGVCAFHRLRVNAYFRNLDKVQTEYSLYKV